MNKFIVAIAAALALLVFGSSATANSGSPFAASERSVFSDRAIAERIKPSGTVCVEGDNCGVATVADAGNKEPRSGEAVFNSSCTACHSTGAAGAPRMGNAGEWASHIAKGIDTLYKHSIEGFNAMPPKGLCMDCSDEELHAAVDYMVSKSK
ncbi:c-type cytochrome [Isoalcanivorax beigongshangi]|uniref:Cytochrome c5 family protein n=1 Tax=Isoalcanivorax beigongshangi TaxID=3238810 RepID=A0ABV4AD72_9GAMM